jgi:peptidoglycan/LPS O-acetylase OafA/YrhL
MPGYDAYLFNTSPTMLLFAGAVFVFTKHCFVSRHTESALMLRLSNGSYSVLLIHWGVLHVAVKQILNINVQSYGIIGGCLLMILFTSVLSIIGAELIDRTLIAALRFLFSKIVGAL